MKIIVYSVNTGGYDDFREPKIYDPNVRYILFTDNKYYKSKIWEICHTDFLPKNLDNRRKARYIKLNPHIVLPEHDVSIWVDHCYVPKFKNGEQLLKEIGHSNISCFKHDSRNCIYSESEEVKKQKLDHQNIVDNQMKRYRMEGFPANLGLFDSGFTIRTNNQQVKNFNNTWWKELSENSARDQLSQVYSSWKTKTPISTIKTDRSIYSNRYLESKIRHPKKWVV
jgi:hypothetical protein